MKINTDDLIKIYRFYIQEQIPRSKKRCPSPKTIMNLFTTSGSTHKKGRIVEHLTSCRYCAHEFAFSLDIYREEGILLEEIYRLLPQTDRIQAAKERSAIAKNFCWLDSRYLFPHWKFAVLFLLAIIVVAVAILTTKQFLITQKNMERGRTPGQIQPMAPVHGKAIQTPLIFRWKLVGKSDYSILEIFDEALSPIWKGPKIYKDSYQLPPEIEAKMEKNKIYYWMVTIFLVDGKVIESPLENFTLIK